MSVDRYHSGLTGKDLSSRLVADGRIHCDRKVLVAVGYSNAGEAVRIVECDPECTGILPGWHSSFVIRDAGMFHEDGLRAKLLA